MWAGFLTGCGHPISRSESIGYYITIPVRSAFSLVASCVLLKYTRTDDVNCWSDLIQLIYFAGLRMVFANFIII